MRKYLKRLWFFRKRRSITEWYRFRLKESGLKKDLSDEEIDEALFKQMEQVKSMRKNLKSINL